MQFNIIIVIICFFQFSFAGENVVFRYKGNIGPRIQKHKKHFNTIKLFKNLKSALVKPTTKINAADLCKKIRNMSPLITSCHKDEPMRSILYQAPDKPDSSEAAPMVAHATSCPSLQEAGELAGSRASFLTGNDFARRDFRAYRGPRSAQNVGVIDSAIDQSCFPAAQGSTAEEELEAPEDSVVANCNTTTHGVQVMSYMFDERGGASTFVGTEHSPRYRHVSAITDDLVAVTEAGAERVLDQMCEQDPPLSVVNYSGAFIYGGEDRATATDVNTRMINRMNRLAECTVLIRAAGNNESLRAYTGDWYTQEEERVISESGGIAVGAVHSAGYMEIQRNLRRLDILGPTYTGMVVQGTATGSYPNGTSMAAPVVSGHVSDILTVLPGLNTEQVKMFLQKSGSPTNGELPPFLNQARGAKVAIRIAQLCPNRQPECINQKIAANSTYDFASEATALEQGLDDIDNECPATQTIQRLREAYFLDPTEARRNRLNRIFQAATIPLAQPDGSMVNTFINPNFGDSQKPTGNKTQPAAE